MWIPQNTGYGGYGAPDTGYGAPSSGYGAASSGYSEPTSGYSSRADLVSSSFILIISRSKFVKVFNNKVLINQQWKSTFRVCVCLRWLLFVRLGWAEPWAEGALSRADPTARAAQISPGCWAQVEAAHCLPGERDNWEGDQFSNRQESAPDLTPGAGQIGYNYWERWN